MHLEPIAFQPHPQDPRFQNLTGQIFGRLTVLGFAGTEKGQKYWHCKCSCGNTVKVRAWCLKAGQTRSCRCLAKETTSTCNSTHGHSRGGKMTPTYQSWKGMKSRCLQQSDPDYPKYGGRGITVCDRWIESFENFLADMGERPEGMTIDRKDNNGGYYPENCRWATLVEQNRNKRSNRLITSNGETLTQAEWAKRLGTNDDRIYCRLNKLGWSDERAVTEPITPNPRRKIERAR